MRIAGRFHVDIDRGAHSELGRLAAVGGNAVRHELVDRGIIGNDWTVKAPLLAQHVMHEPAACRGRHALHGVETRHNQVAPGIHRGLVGRQVLVAHAPLAHVHGVVLAAGLGRAIARKVLDAARDAALGGAVALKALDHRAGKAAAQIRILARHLQAAAPARIAHHVDGRAKGHHAAIGNGFFGNKLVVLADAVGVPCGTKAQRDGVAGLVAIDYVGHKDERDLEAAALQIGVLDAMHLLGAQHVEHASAHIHVLLRHAQLGARTHRYGIGTKAPAVELHQLPDLFAQRHVPQQIAKLGLLHCYLVSVVCPYGRMPDSCRGQHPPVRAHGTHAAPRPV